MRVGLRVALQSDVWDCKNVAFSAIDEEHSVPTSKCRRPAGARFVKGMSGNVYGSGEGTFKNPEREDCVPFDKLCCSE